MIALQFVCALGMLLSLIGFLETVRPVSAAENLPEYAEYAVCLTGPDPRAQTDPEHFAGSALGFAPAKGVVTNAIPHWHFQDAARDLGVPVSELVSTLTSAYQNEGKCVLFNFYRSDDAGGTHHNAFFPYGAGATPIMLTLLPLDKASDSATGEGKEYAPESMDDEAARGHGVNGNQGQTLSDQVQRRGKE